MRTPTERSGPTHKRARAVVPGTPRAVMRRATGPGVTVGDVPDVAAAARVARCPRRVLDAWREFEAAGDEAHLVAAQRETLSWLNPTRTGRRVDVDHALAKARARADVCGDLVRVFHEEGRGLHAIPERCKARVCAACQRRALRRTLDRWRPLFAVPVLPGYVVSFVTVTSTRNVETAADLSKYLRALGRLVYAMREGVPRFGISPRSWVAGVRALELVPREAGGFSHAHLLVVRRAFIPYGKAATNLPAAPAPGDLGMRALLRSLGMGEVMRVDDVTTEHDGEGATAVEAYMGKVEKYMGKVEKGLDGEEVRYTWDGRDDLQRATRGARLVEAFGDARGLLGGPDEVERTRDGEACAPWTLRGVYDPADPDTWDALPGGVAVEDGPEVTVTRRTYYRADTLDAWRTWADVDALTRGLRMARGEGHDGVDDGGEVAGAVDAPFPRLAPSASGEGGLGAADPVEYLSGGIGEGEEGGAPLDVHEEAHEARGVPAPHEPPPFAASIFAATTGASCVSAASIGDDPRSCSASMSAAFVSASS